MSKINDTELRKLLDEVAEDLQKAFEDSKETLVKAEESSSSSSSSMAKDFPPEASGSGSESSASGSAPAPAPEASASGSAPEASASESSGSSADEMGAPPEGAPEGAGDPAAEQGAELTPEALQAEYSKLAPEELEMHIHAALAAKEAAMGAAGDAGAPAAAPMAPPAGAAPVGAPAEGAGPALKGEGAMTPAKVKAMAKAEVSAEVEALRAQLQAQHEDIEVLTKALTAMQEQPLRKAIVSVRPEARQAEVKDLSKLTMKDVNEHLSKLTAQPSLKKADRDLINDFYERRAGIEKLAPLFETYGK